jgi:uncharacterized SAM-binding protein YcdF (DUF218 family)
VRAALAILGVVLGAAAAAAVLGAGRLLVVRDPLPARADAVVVMAGSIPDRVLEAAALYRAGVAPRVVVTRERLRRGERALRARGVRLPEAAEQTLGALHALGVPPSATHLIPRRTRSTDDEARTIARWVCARARSIVVVTSRYHARRARLILAQALGPTVALALRPSRYDPFEAARWWRDRRDAKAVLSEYEKLVHYWLRERWLLEPCRPRRTAPRASALPDRLAHERGELAARVHLAHDVAAADELPRHVELRDRRPVRELLDGLALLGLGEHVDRLERHADVLQHLHRRGGEPAHRERRRALHVQHDRVLADLALDLGDHVVHPLASCGVSV